MNQYDCCTMEKYIKGKHCKILWYVGDINKSQKYTKVLTTILNIIESIYGRQHTLAVSHGNYHEYLVITLEFSNKGKLKFNMYDYIPHILEYLPEEIKNW